MKRCRPSIGRRTPEERPQGMKVRRDRTPEERPQVMKLRVRPHSSLGNVGPPEVVIPGYLVLGYKVGPHEVTYQGY